MGKMDLEQKAIERLKEASKISLEIYHEPLLLTYSGGKDSEVLLLLAKRAKIPFEVCHSHTTVDAPPTVYHVRETFKQLELEGIKCGVEYGMYKGKRASMWSLIVQKKMPPTRIMRYCCDILKETSGDGRFIATGVRWSESTRRKNTRGIYETVSKNPQNKIVLTNDNDDKRLIIENCYKRKKMICNPIVEWTDKDIWDYLNESKVCCNPLYKIGFNRVGCVGCPMAGRKGMEKEFDIFPQYRFLYVRTFDKMVKARREAGLTEESLSSPWRNGEDVMRWWLGYDHAQITFDDLEMEDE